MNALKLYQIAGEIESLLDGGIDEDGVMSEELGTALSKFEGKGKAVAAYILNQKATAAAIDETIKKLEKRAQTFRNRVETLSVYLQENMKRTGVPSIDADDGTFSAKLFIDRDKSVEVFSSELLPASYLRYPKTPEPTPDKTKIKADIESGIDVPGAKIVKKDRLEIKA